MKILSSFFPWGESSRLESWSVNEICGWGRQHAIYSGTAVDGCRWGFDLFWWMVCALFTLMMSLLFSSCCTTFSSSLFVELLLYLSESPARSIVTVVMWLSALSCHPFSKNQQPTKSSKWRWMIAFQPSLFPGFVSVCVGNLISSSFLSLSLSRYKNQQTLPLSP